MDSWHLPLKSFNNKYFQEMLDLDEKTFTSRLKNRSVLLVNPQKTKIKKLPKIKNLPVDNCTYQFYLPLHQLWLEYAANLHDESFLKAEYFGCLLTVEQSKCPSNIGICGIVAKESENMFHLVTTANVLKIIPKKNNVFSFIANRKKYTIHGSHFMFRPWDRASKKFKPKPTIDM